jgi:hypothetical protein
MANGVEGAYPGAKEADRLALKAQIDDMRRRLILMESRVVSLMAQMEALIQRRNSRD